MTQFEIPGDLEELTMEGVKERGLVATGPPVTLESSGEWNVPVSRSFYKARSDQVPDDAIAFVSADGGGCGGSYTFIAIQFYAKP